MEKILKFCLLLICFIITRNSYAWVCYYTPDQNGYISEGSLNCIGIDDDEALSQHWCVNYQPSDPICDQYREPVCTDLVEYQTLSCPIHYSGGIQQSRTKTCATNTWTDWWTSSNNCTPDPATCHERIDTQTISCGDGYNGTITQTNTYTCPTPYSEPIMTGWVDTNNSCVKSITNVENVASPINPASPVNPMPVIPVAPLPPVMDAPMPMDVPMDMPQAIPVMPTERKTEQKTTTTPKVETNSQVETKPEVKTTSKKETKKQVEVKKEEKQEILAGFGLVLSLELMNQPLDIYGYQPQITDQFSIEQDFSNDYKRIEEIYLDILTQDHLYNDYVNRSNRSSYGIWGNYLLQ